MHSLVLKRLLHSIMVTSKARQLRKQVAPRREWQRQGLAGQRWTRQRGWGLRRSRQSRWSCSRTAREQKAIWKNIGFYHFINWWPVVFHRSIDENQIGCNDDNVAAYDASHIGLVVGHVMPDGEDEGLVVLGEYDRVVDDATKLKNCAKRSYEPGNILMCQYFIANC